MSVPSAAGPTPSVSSNCVLCSGNATGTTTASPRRDGKSGRSSQPSMTWNSGFLLGSRSGLTTSMIVVCDASHTTGCQDASDPTQFASVATYDTNNGASNGAPTGSVNLVEVKIKGY